MDPNMDVNKFTFQNRRSDLTKALSDDVRHSDSSRRTKTNNVTVCNADICIHWGWFKTVIYNITRRYVTTTLNGTNQLLVYADDANIFCRSNTLNKNTDDR